MNLILLFEKDFSPDGSVKLTARRAKHIFEIHRAKPGDTLIVGKEGGPIGSASVLSVSKKEVVLLPTFTQYPPKGIQIEVLLAMPRPRVFRRLLATLSTLGVKRLVLLKSARVEKSYFHSPVLEKEAQLEAISLGLEQARDTILPNVLIQKRFRSFVEDDLPIFWPNHWIKLLAHPETEHSLIDCQAMIKSKKSVVIAIGPEGGWIPFEIALLEEAGFSTFTLGNRILRVETVLPFLIGQIQMLRQLR